MFIVLPRVRTLGYPGYSNSSGAACGMTGRKPVNFLRGIAETIQREEVCGLF